MIGKGEVSFKNPLKTTTCSHVVKRRAQEADSMCNRESSKKNFKHVASGYQSLSSIVLRVGTVSSARVDEKTTERMMANDETLILLRPLLSFCRSIVLSTSYCLAVLSPCRPLSDCTNYRPSCSSSLYSLRGFFVPWWLRGEGV